MTIEVMMAIENINIRAMMPDSLFAEKPAGPA
jgi:hypothetical protein